MTSLLYIGSIMPGMARDIFKNAKFSIGGVFVTNKGAIYVPKFLKIPKKSAVAIFIDRTC